MGLADVAGARELGEPVEPELVEPWEPDALDPGTLCTPPSNPSTLPLPWPMPRIPAGRPVRGLSRCRTARTPSPDPVSRCPGYRSRQLWPPPACGRAPPNDRRRSSRLASSRKISAHGCGLPRRMGNHNRYRRLFRHADYLVRQHIDGPRERRPERHGDDADGTGIRNLDDKGLGDSTVHRQRPRGKRGNRGARFSPGCPRGRGGRPRRSPGTSSRGATAQSAVKARTVTPSLVRVN